jgi:hypothetical protein
MTRYENYDGPKHTEEELWHQAINEAGIVSRDTGAVWDAIKEAVDDEFLTLLVGDFITADQLNALYRTWELAMGKRQQEQPDDEILELVATLAIRDEQLATARDDFHNSERDGRRWKKRAKKAEAKLAEFDEVFLHIVRFVDEIRAKGQDGGDG